MAYTKQTWTNDVSKVNADRMNHIELGIEAISNDVTSLNNKVNPSGTATTTAEIEEGQINDVIGFRSLKLKGQTSQETTQGNNLLNIYARHPAGYTETVSGVTITYNDDGSITAKGTATADIAYLLVTDGLLGDDIFNGTNYLSGCTGGSLTTFYLQFWADTIGRFQNVTTEVATNKTAGVSWNIAIIIINGVTINKRFYPMMSATSGKTFEKYSGGKASPNPDFPQQVENVSGYNVVGISNKNLFSKSGNDGRYVLIDTGAIGTNADYYATDFIPVKNSALYGFYSTGMGSAGKLNIAEYDENKNYLGHPINNANGFSTFTTNANTKYVRCVCLMSKKNETYLYYNTSSAGTYIAHLGNNFEINLGKQLIQDETFVQGSYFDNATTTRISCRNAKLKANTTYTLSTNLDFSTFNIALATQIIPFPNNLTLIYDSTWKAGTFSFTTGNQSVYTNISVRKSNNANITPDEVEGVWLMLEEGAIATSYAPYFPPIELCKIGTYQDYIYKKDGKWWKHNEISKYILNGGNNENWLLNSSGTYYKYQWATALPDKYNVANTPILCNYFQQITVIQGDGKNIIGIVNGHYSDYSLQIISDISTLSDFKTWLAENKPTVYYPLATPIEEEITYTPLIRQLDELYNSGLYDVTNISQDNSSEAFILDLEACKNNINGIVEYIRR